MGSIFKSMSFIFSKIVGILASIVAILTFQQATPVITPTPTPDIISVAPTDTPISSITPTPAYTVTPSPTPAPQVSHTSTPTPVPTPDLIGLVQQINDLQHAIASMTPEPTPTPIIIYVSATPTPTPASTPTPVATPTPEPTPTPTPASVLPFKLSASQPIISYKNTNIAQLIENAPSPHFVENTASPSWGVYPTIVYQDFYKFEFGANNTNDRFGWSHSSLIFQISMTGNIADFEPHANIDNQLLTGNTVSIKSYRNPFSFLLSFGKTQPYKADIGSKVVLKLVSIKEDNSQRSIDVSGENVQLIFEVTQ